MKYTRQPKLTLLSLMKKGDHYLDESGYLCVKTDGDKSFRIRDGNYINDRENDKGELIEITNIIYKGK